MLINFGLFMLFFFIGHINTQRIFPDPNKKTPTPKPPPCPDLMCTLEFIPEECRETPILTLNGVTCSGCPKRKPECTGTLPINRREPQIACPLYRCDIQEPIPEECKEIPTYTFGGRTCLRCPKWREGCVPSKPAELLKETEQTRNVAQIACPLYRCDIQEPIPEECKEIPTYTFGGRTCLRCPKWREGCVPSKPAELLKETEPTRNVPQIACRLYRCDIQEPIPEECKEIPTYTFGGRTCSRCPKWREGCVPSKITESLLNSEPARNILQTACPIMRCQANIPVECRVKREYQTKSGRTCTRCPDWREGCREQERISSNNGLRPTSDLRPAIPCPFMKCSSIPIPDGCKEEQPYDFGGRTCFRCPRWRTGCKGSPEATRLQPTLPEVACPLIACDLPDLPPACFQEGDMYTFLGKMCRKCPIVRTACQTMVPPRPVAVVNPLKIVPVGERIVCPLQACPSVYIPAECREMVTFQFRGQTCQGCPQFKEGCLPMGNIQQPAKPTDIPQIPNIPQIPAVDPVACPELGCPFINIPQDCLEQPTYNYKGIVCNHCPLWREGCVPGSALNNEEKVAPPCPVFRCRPVDQAIPKECIEVPTVFIRGRNCTTCPRYRPGCAASGLPVDTNRPGPTTSETPVVPTGPDKEISCPLVPCTKILIPQECREQTPFQFMGKTCLGCPVWREGCVPGSDRELNTNTITETPTTTTQSMPADKIACPLMQCNRMFIPLECREVTSFLYLNVKQCYRCPKWRVGCIPGDKNRDLLNTNAVNRNTDNINTNTGRINFGNDAISGSNAPNTGSNSISDMRGVLPVNQLLNMVNEINCPPLPCPAVFIPRHCQVAHSYVYEGISCAGCPSWRPGCSAFDGSWQNSHFDGLLAYNLFRELAGFNA